MSSPLPVVIPHQLYLDLLEYLACSASGFEHPHVLEVISTGHQTELLVDLTKLDTTISFPLLASLQKKLLEI